MMLFVTGNTNCKDFMECTVLSNVLCVKICSISCGW